MNRLFPLYADKTLDDFQILNHSHDAATQDVKTYLAALPEALTAGYGLTFVGPTGTGKTHLAQMVLKEAQHKGFTIESIELSTYIKLHHDRIMYAEQDNGDALDKTLTQIRRIRSKTDFVLLDDVGREYDGGSGWATQILFDTLRFRYNRKRPFLVTTNLPVDSLDERYTEGLTGLLSEVTKIILLKGDDFRAPRADRDY